MGRTFDHGGGVRGIEVPIPDNPLGHTLVYVLDTDRGPVLLDTGWDDPASWDALTEGLRACGTSVADVHGVVVTHHHPDHHGLSGRVREASGAWVAMHAADAAVVRRARAGRPEQWYAHLAARLTAAGAPDAHVAPLRTARGPAPGLSPALPDRGIAPGGLLPLPGRRLRALWTPGHTPGHVCLHLEERHPARLTGRGRLFSGDHLLPGISPHIGLYQDPGGGTPAGDAATDPLGDYLGSLARLSSLAPAEVLPAHQHPFTGAAARVRELLAHHEARLTGLLALLTEPRTPWQLAERMDWNRPWARLPPTSRSIAVSEAEAHLRHLVRRGRAEPVAGSDPVSYLAR